MTKIRVGIIGATGYTALELLKLLRRHPQAAVRIITSRQNAGQNIADVHPSLDKTYDLTLETLDIPKIANETDCVFCCLPHAASAEIISQLDSGIRIVDFSADYRLNDADTYRRLYEKTHPQPEQLGQIPYGLPELFTDEIAAANLVANPGCFPTSVILPLAPLIKNDLVESSDIIVDSKTGVSGAGRNAKLKFHFPESNENVAAYAVGSHRHGPEMEQIIARATNVEASIIFTPHLVPMTRGILSTIYLKPSDNVRAKQIADCWREAYQSQPFVRITKNIPATKDVSGSNYCDLWAGESGDRIIVVSTIDNLIKGASGAALQNFNVMYGMDQSWGLPL